MKSWLKQAASLEVWVQKRVEISCVFCHRKTEITTGSLSVCICMHVPENAWKGRDTGHVEVFFVQVVRRAVCSSRK